MEKKVLFNVLKEIAQGGSGTGAAPDKAYLKALETIGFINLAWDNCLTPFGREMYNNLIQEQWR